MSVTITEFPATVDKREEITRTMLTSLREFRSRPGVSTVAVITLALGVAGATSMFAMLGAMGAAMVPPGVDAARIARVVWTALDESGARGSLTAQECTSLVAGTSAFESFAFWSGESTVVGEDGPTASVQRISPDFFQTLRFTVSAGRTFTRDEYREGATGTVIASERFLRRFPAYGLGKPVRFGNRDYTIVGILPDRAWYPAAGTEIWMPLSLSRDGSPLADSVSVAVRLRSPDRLEQARAQLSVLTARLTAGEQSGRPRKLSLITLEQDANKRAGFGLVGLIGPSVVVLLIACGNVANLLLARATRREREMAVRAALGASRWRLMRERLAESAWPAAAGGALGFALALAAVGGLRAWVASVPESREAAQAIRIDERALLFALAVTAVIPFVVGLVPAFVASRPNLQSALHASPGRRKPRRGPYGGRDVLVVVEVGLAVVLVVWAGMFASFFTELWRVRWGFDAAKVVAVELSLKRDGARPGADAELIGDVLAALRQVPGVDSAASGSVVGLDPIWRGTPIEFEGCAAASSALGAVMMPVDADFFMTLGIPVRRGRGIGLEDASGSPRVAVVSQRHADRCWPGHDPLGRRLRSGGAKGAEWITVVGVAPDAMTTKAVEMVQPVYVPVTQVARVPSTVFVRARGDGAALIGPLRSAVRRVDKGQPLDAVGRLDEQLRAELSGAPVIVGIIGGFGLFALALAALGVFSVVSYMVAERTREFGIRMALGASRSAVLRMVVGQATAIVAVGGGVSIVGTLAVTRTALREVAVLAITDPMLWVAVVGLLAMVAVAASIVPARRATSVQPSAALRAE
jgi:putative ABC transport system permease protein